MDSERWTVRDLRPKHLSGEATLENTCKTVGQLIQCLHYIHYSTGLTLEYVAHTKLFIYQARESSLVPVGFWTAQFLQKT